MPNPTETTLILQRLDAQENRADDMAKAFAKLRAELDETTASVREMHLWVVHKPLERRPELHPKNTFES